jgi:hypothetical protein
MVKSKSSKSIKMRFTANLIGRRKAKVPNKREKDTHLHMILAQKRRAEYRNRNKK